MLSAFLRLYRYMICPAAEKEKAHSLHEASPAADAKCGRTEMNWLFHALACRLVTQARFIFFRGCIMIRIKKAECPLQDTKIL